MENKEIPQNLTPEEIERQKKNLEQKQEEKIESSKEEDPAIRLSSINETVAKKEENIQNTQGEINEIRGGLGLPPTDEVPPSIKNDRDSIAKLNKEKSDLEHKNKMSEVSQESQNEDTKKFEGNLRIAMDDISSKSKTMLDALYERQQDRLTQLQSNDHFQMMASSIKNLKSFEGKIDIDSVTKLIEDINKLARLFDDFKVQQTSMIRENPQNLEKLAFGAKSFSISAQENGRKLPIEMQNKEMEEKSKELRNSLHNLSEQSEKLWMFAVKLLKNSR